MTAQIAFAFMLLIGAGLLLASFQRVLGVRPGFDAGHVMTGVVSPPASRYKEDAQLLAFWDRLPSASARCPGVQAAGITSSIPLGGNYNDSVILAEGYVMEPGESLISPYNTRVSPGYFEAMRIPLNRGRLFRASDDERAPKVMVIDERLAARFFGDKDPIGRRMWQADDATELARGPGKTARFYTIVGVVGSMRMRGLTESEPVGAYYFPVAQNAIRGMTLVARTSGEPEALTQADSPRSHRPRSRIAVLRRAADADADRRVAHQPPDADAARIAVRRHRGFPGRVSESTACWPIRWRSGAVKSASAWRSAASRAASSSSCCRRVCCCSAPAWRWASPAPSRSVAPSRRSCSASAPSIRWCS